ncbi:hypothetical protein [Salimicrobium halophilum]|uniref:SbsA Ig-like domain-containing protein n=1 Tax=Salimicrobium halophilum TaxID=86666 RepID=A0A1G8S535_9BACI|nr:hypothetical protein [Salimicrobium halophilum]SDJ24339.1 hypothetical protein SAMN04490247_1257 [Salimicrobium halophilum]
MNWRITAIILFLFLSFPVIINAEDTWSVTPDKTWTIDFNKNMDTDRQPFLEAAREHVYVKDSEGYEHPVNISVPDLDRLKVAPQESYTVGESYTLVVQKTLRDSNGRELVSRASRTFDVHPYGEHLGSFTSDKPLPSYAKNTTIDALHSLPYWEWVEKDRTYLKQEISKQQLFGEMEQLQEELEEVSSNYLEVNGFHFYTSAIHSKLDALKRAMKARYNLLYFNQYNYPATSVTYNEEQATLEADDRNEGSFEVDRKIYNALLDYPYDTSYTDNITVVSTPFTFEGINGFAKSSDSTIYLSALQEDPVKTFYHELGHMFDYFFEPPRQRYEEIRNYSSFDDTYENSYTESFAEDFKVVRYPYEGVLANLNDIGTPKEETRVELESFFKEQEQKEDPEVPSLLINGTPIYSDIQVAQSETVTFSGENLYGSIQVETPAGEQDSVELGDTFTFSEEGVYTFSTPIGKVLFLFDKDGVWSPNEEGPLQRVTMGQLTGEVYEWASALEFEPGIFKYNRDYSILMINAGYYQPFQITDKTITSDEIRLELAKGQEDYYIFALPESMQDKSVIIENNFLNIPG